MSQAGQGDTGSTTRLQCLPKDAISAILKNCDDFQTILNIAQNDRLREAIYSQGWKCGHCQNPIFTDSDLSTAKHVNPFICAVCQENFCGEAVDYDKRSCRPQKCDGCGKIECFRCLEAHMGDEDGYGSENYCEECQAEFEFGMGGC